MRFCFFFIILGSILITSCASTINVSEEEKRYPKIIAEKAYTEFNEKRYKNAIAYYQYILDNYDRNLFPKDVAWAYYEIGFCYYYQSKYKKALSYFDIVMREFTVLPPKVLAQRVIDDIYTKKPNLKPMDYIETNDYNIEVINDED